MSENKENKKNKNLNEKEIEKVSGGQKIITRNCWHIGKK